MTTTAKKKVSARVAGSRVTPRRRATASKGSLPRGTARTAWSLLKRVCAVIRAEPKRYDQTNWLLKGKRDIADFYGRGNVPACGTVGCRAGWIVALHDGDDVCTYNMAGRANQILGLSMDHTSALFSGGDCVEVPQTAAHANEGVAGIRAFMALHADHLKARSLKGV